MDKSNTVNGRNASAKPQHFTNRFGRHFIKTMFCLILLFCTAYNAGSEPISNVR